jgi:A/G-specific adenine glycosylase
MNGDAFAQALVAWQREHGRHDLPWQRSRDPYAVWISEIMLQQTQVSTVLGYFDRFMQRFPTVQSLAGAPLDDVLAAWSGLGYYRRARMAHRCAQVVVAQHGGRFPPNSQTLQTLPGIGASTAAAIASTCFEERSAILDGNVKRVLTRFLNHDEDITRAKGLRALQWQAESLLPVDGRDMPTYTQAIMDLGATVCLTRQPHCLICPVSEGCKALALGRVHELPVAPKRLKRGRRESVCLLLRQGQRVWLVQRPEQGVWAGLWSLPEFADFESLASATEGWKGEGQLLPTIEHALTHFDWTLKPRCWTWPDDEATQSLTPRLLASQHGAQRGAWWTLEDALSKAGLPTPWRRLLTGLIKDLA